MPECIFCEIAQKRAQADIVYEDDDCVAFRDINPQAPTHVLVVPKRHIESLSTLTAEDKELAGSLMLAAAKVAEQLGIVQPGYRVVINTNPAAGQTVFHIHLHVLGGRTFGWPPG